MVWALRAIVLWGAIELGLTLFDEGLREAETFSAIRGHTAAMARLERRAQEIESAARAEAAALSVRRAGAGALNPPAGETPEQAINDVIRTDLVALGAQTPQVASSVTPLGPSLYRATVEAEWGETQGASSSSLAALATKRPYLSATSVTFQRVESAPLVKTKAQFQFNFEMRKGTTK